MSTKSPVWGLGKVCPARFRTLFAFALFFFLLGNASGALQPGSPPSVLIYLDEVITEESRISQENLIGSMSGYEGAIIQTEYLSGEWTVLVVVNGLDSGLPPNTDIAIISIDNEGEVDEYLIRTDGGTVLVALDDF